MGERTAYVPGTFSWVDLSTPDQEGAKAFYGALFGWESVDMPVGEGAFYSMQRIEGKDVAAISAQPQAQRDAGVPPLWNSYVSVEDVDASAARAAALGGHVHAGPFDVMEAGRMAVVQDPQGAFFMLWQARGTIGAGLVNAPGAFSWNELSTPDMDGASAFYSGVFGWHFVPMESSPTPYLVIKNGDASNGGIRPLDPPGMPPNWLVYLAIEDIESGIAKVGELGGNVIMGPMDIGMAKIAVVADPQGAVFALYDGMLEP